jgi:hypothetical protein
MNTFEQQKKLLADHTDIIGMTLFQFIAFCETHQIPFTERNFKEFSGEIIKAPVSEVFDNEDVFKPDYYGEHASPERFDIDLGQATTSGMASQRRKPLDEKQIAEAVEKQKQRVLSCVQIEIKIISERGGYMGMSIPNPSMEQKKLILPFYIGDY